MKLGDEATRQTAKEGGISEERLEPSSGLWREDMSRHLVPRPLPWFLQHRIT